MKVEYFPMGKIYYSKMNQTPETVFISEVAVLTKAFGVSDVTFHGGGQYHEDKLTSSKLVIVTGFNGDLVGRGVFAEINNAILNDIPVFQFLKLNNNLFNGAVVFRKISECVTHDTTDYYLMYGKCKYLKDVKNNDVNYSIDYLTTHFSGLQGPTKKKAPEKRGPGRDKNSWDLDDDEEEVMSESDDKEASERYFTKSNPKPQSLVDDDCNVRKSKPKPEAKRMPNENKPGADDFDGDTNMMY